MRILSEEDVDRPRLIIRAGESLRSLWQFTRRAGGSLRSLWHFSTRARHAQLWDPTQERRLTLSIEGTNMAYL